ncbi:hypothetical protein CDAR_616491 [Caerostris darwini]|uniref:Lipase domain-containing protein n=1 Tax=Caerostris darwini TaxID=1538125 RepID=A0AAV4VMX6_9ARAC|nr:hypothetical protein CDAR_616491 [Caerostris darwini]
MGRIEKIFHLDSYCSDFPIHRFVLPSVLQNGNSKLIIFGRNCNHQSAPNFLQSINTTECLFWSVHCDNYDDFMDGQCPPETSAMNLMGLPAKKIDDLSPKSKFYLRIGIQFPYYLKNGYEPPV